jgi:phosphoserine phosphatase
MIKLICLDLGGVLVPADTFWMELHKRFGTLDEGVALTKQYLQSDYPKLVEEVVGRLWQGKDAHEYHDLVRSVPYNAGINELFLELDRFTAANDERIQRVIISGDCYDVAQRIADEFGIDIIFANQLIAEDGRISGEFRWPVGAGGASKRQIIEQLCDDFELLPQEVLMIGDSDGDLEAFRICGISIAYNAKSKELRAAATHAVDSRTLADIVPVLRGIRERAA